MPAIRELQSDGWRVRLDLASQMLQAEVPEFDMDLRRLNSKTKQDVLSATLPMEAGAPISAATLLLKAKQFDDGLYAAVEVAAQRGAGRFKGKAALLRSLAEALRGSAAAAAQIHAACRLGGVSVDIPSELKGTIREVVEMFMADEKLSKPLGFYTWTPELSAIFRQDRFLQQPLDSGTADEFVGAMKRSAEASDIYDSWLRLNALLSNPPARPDLHGAAASRSFMPASRSHEQILFERLFGDRPVPEGFDIMSELIRRVRSDEIDLRPSSTSGWYDFQTWSLGALLVPERMPEATRIEFGKRYCDYLEQLFRGALALARETHGKQLAVALGGCDSHRNATIYLCPRLSVEPLPSLYGRRAEGYRFVRSVLVEAFGPTCLAGMHRRSSEEASKQSIADELIAMEGLFDGAAALARRDLGMEPEPNDATAIDRFLEWQSGLGSDKDVGRDARMMAPVFYDLQRRKTKIWAFLGWRTVSVDVTYLSQPSVVAIESSTPPEPEATDRLSVLRRKFRKSPDQPPAATPNVQFQGERYHFAEPVMAEVYVEKLLDRDEFRRHCDRYLTREAILANLR